MSMEKGNIVAEYMIDGHRVLVTDAGFAGKSEAELEAFEKTPSRWRGKSSSHIWRG
jgi:hypothetical protein